MKIAVIKGSLFQFDAEDYFRKNFLPEYITEWTEVTQKEYDLLKSFVGKRNSHFLDYILIEFPDQKMTINLLLENAKKENEKIEKLRKEQQERAEKNKKEKEVKTKEQKRKQFEKLKKELGI